MLFAELAYFPRMVLLEATEEITLFAVDMSSQASVDFAEHVQNRREVSPFHGIH